MKSVNPEDVRLELSTTAAQPYLFFLQEYLVLPWVAHLQTEREDCVGGPRAVSLFCPFFPSVERPVLPSTFTFNSLFKKTL